MPVAVTTWATAFLQCFMLSNHRCRNNASRDSNNCITDQHDNSRKEPSQRRCRRNIAIPDGCHRDNRPINAIRNIIKPGIRIRSFYHIHHRSHRSYQDQDKEKEDKDLRGADPQRAQKQISFVNKLEKFEDTEYPNQTKSPDH